jgi:dihydroorotate dehydrogenase (fumarate)
MDLSTKYLGLDLKNPLVAAASPLSRQTSSACALEKAGIAAIVVYSIFQEAIEHEAAEHDHYMEFGTDSFAEALSYVPDQPEAPRGPEHYVEHIAALKTALDIPVIASLNGTSHGGWVEYAKQIEQAGADAIELNTYYIAADPDTAGDEIERRYLSVLAAVANEVRIPVAMKLNPFISALAHFAKRLEEAGAAGLVLFNRFYQPDIDLEKLEVDPRLELSAPHEMRLPLRWIAILDPIVKCSLAASTGIYTAADVLKVMMAGADAAMLCAAILRDGSTAVADMLTGMETWMKAHGYESIRQMQGSMNQASCPNPVAFERGNYMRALNSYTPNI